MTDLVTLDPISKVDCTPDGFITAVLGGGGNDPGCTRAPTDFGAAGLAQIAAKVPGKWQNFYQTDLAALHPGPIAQTTSNTKRSYPGAQGFDAHNDLLGGPDGPGGDPGGAAGGLSREWPVRGQPPEFVGFNWACLNWCGKQPTR